VNDELFIIHVERVDTNKEERPATGVLGEVRGEVAIEVVTASSGTSTSRTQVIYMTKDAADDLVQMLGKHLLALE
jgi:hypothetical protein